MPHHEGQPLRRIDVSLARAPHERGAAPRREGTPPLRRAAGLLRRQGGPPLSAEPTGVCGAEAVGAVVHGHLHGAALRQPCAALRRGV